ncbi:alpha/beta fold hydrolase [Lewinella cohaerens]|uniref:alpha/beta fold hydrolase n=1 Tax=Lewinella cohaerens TaxID=70995 RepID=UPI0003639993|nr:alpha/beta hydrolase [Lewinella cohaerens]
MNYQKLLFKAIGVRINFTALFNVKKAGQRTYRLFTTPPKPQLREKELDFLATATRLDSMRAGRSIVEYHWGAEDAPYILLSYGWGYNSGRWRYFVEPLIKAGYRVIAYDPPGHGQAVRERLNFVENVDIITGLIRYYGRPEITIGHSFGGACSVQAMALLPKSLHPQRMVVMGAFSNAQTSVFKSLKDGLGLGQAVYSAFENCIKEAAGDRFTSFDIGRGSAALGHISALIVHDPQDEVTAGNQALGFHAYWPGSALYLPLGAKHHLGTPRVTNAIIDFAVRGDLPQTATVQERPLPKSYELASFYKR